MKWNKVFLGWVACWRMEKTRKSVNRPPTPDVAENQEKEPTRQELINIELIESGEKERLMELLRERLIECGWKDEMKALCRAFIKKKGRNNVTVDDLVHVMTPKGRGSIESIIDDGVFMGVGSMMDGVGVVGRLCKNGLVVFVREYGLSR
ncbi:hypothetical protein DVH24_031613 [Malus domestica]|uniref:Transcription and mRNA export factor ENY2 n=1 Tax=Malus domestica TaxID=3750 RepID=A0A498J258_MALDO|nr:hypothetical protein DVH24_031613 [Malus domestica]